MLLSSQILLNFQNNFVPKRKEALDRSDTNGRGKKSKLWGFMATFTMITHIIPVSNYGGVIIPLGIMDT